MRHKYPRTFHVPFSLGATNDDKVLPSLNHFADKEIVVTLKMDGENSSLYTLGEGFHARSVDSRHHSSRDWLAKFHAQVGPNIPEGWRVCGENLYAKHSLGYEDLPSYFLGFSIWNDANVALSWDDTLEMFELLEIKPVPTLYRGVFDEKVLKRLASEMDTTKNEGFVIRVAAPFEYAEFGNSVAKWVRAGHVQTGDHWMHAKIVPNKLHGA